MSETELIRLNAKIYVANCYIDKVAKIRGKVDAYDIHKVVTPMMRPYVTIATKEQVEEDGLPYIRIKEGVA